MVNYISLNLKVEVSGQCKAFKDTNGKTGFNLQKTLPCMCHGSHLSKNFAISSMRKQLKNSSTRLMDFLTVTTTSYMDGSTLQKTTGLLF